MSDLDLGAEILAGLHQHRIATTLQVHQMHAPHLSERRVLQVLADLSRQGFVLCYQPSARSRCCWFLSPAGYRAVAETGEPRAHRMTPEKARAGLRLHSLAVNEVGLSFVQAARERGDECDWTAWRHETVVGRKVLTGRDLIADATLEYQIADEPMLHFYVELDRGTTSAAELIAKLRAYARLAASQRRFPDLLVVGATMDGAAWDRRWRYVSAEASRTAEVRTAERFRVLSAYLPDLERDGPFGVVWTPLGSPHERVDVAGQVPTRAK